MHFHSCTLTSTDNKPDLLRKLVLFSRTSLRVPTSRKTWSLNLYHQGFSTWTQQQRLWAWDHHNISDMWTVRITLTAANRWKRTGDKMRRVAGKFILHFCQKNMRHWWMRRLTPRQKKRRRRGRKKSTKKWERLVLNLYSLSSLYCVFIMVQLKQNVNLSTHSHIGESQKV